MASNINSPLLSNDIQDVNLYLREKERRLSPSNEIPLMQMQVKALGRIHKTFKIKKHLEKICASTKL